MAPVFGLLCDKFIHPTIINVLGAFIVVLAFTLLGPASFIPLPPNYELSVASMVLQGIGFAAILVSSFTIAHKEAIRNGFPDNLQTYGLVSGLWTSIFALGAFVGPSIGGLLLDKYGMPCSSLFIVVLGLVSMLSTITFQSIHCSAVLGYTELPPE